MNGNTSRETAGIQTVFQEGEQRPEVIAQAVQQYLDGLRSFVSPMGVNPERRSVFALLDSLRKLATERINSQRGVFVEIIAGVNARSVEQRSEDYRLLLERERAQYEVEGSLPLQLGVICCADAGIPYEVFFPVKFGRSLGGDLPLSYNQMKNEFVLGASSIRKAHLHGARLGTPLGVQILVEHTHCGRHGQLLANIDEPTSTSALFRLVRDNLVMLASEFAGNPVQQLQKIQGRWLDKLVENDHGLYVGVLTKIAHRSAYSHSLSLVENPFASVVPIVVFDKGDANQLFGLDRLDILADPFVLQERGFTPEVLESLASENRIFSVKHEVIKMQDMLNAQLTTQRGSKTYENLQTAWLDTNTAIFNTVDKLWQMYNEGNHAIVEMVSRYLHSVIADLPRKLDEVTRSVDQANRKQTKEKMTKYLVTQLFHGIAYAWVLDTFNPEVGNPPGHHMENHCAIGDRAATGTLENIPLSTGTIMPATAAELMTNRAVLLSSQAFADGRPVPILIKQETNSNPDRPLTDSEIQAVNADINTLLEVWPYILVGDIVPMIAVRDANHKGINRLALSALLNFGDITNCFSADLLPEEVLATSTSGQLVMVPARAVLQIGAKTSDLKMFRAQVAQLADTARVIANKTL